MFYLRRLFTTILVCLFIFAGAFTGGFDVKAASYYSGWTQERDSWSYYSNGVKVKGAWAKDSEGWCYLTSDTGTLLKNGWVLDSNGWCYLDSNGYWVNHAALAKDSVGYCVIGDDGYWTGLRQDLGSKSKVEVAKNVVSIVTIQVLDGLGNIYTEASGCIATVDGKVITNYHIIDGASSIKVVLQDGTSYEIDGLTAFSRDKDLAILKLKNPQNLVAMILGDSDKLQLGEDILTIGNPGGYIGTVSEGIVSGLHRFNFDLRQGEDIQISAPITNGSSGGGLFNMSGQLVGITYGGTVGSGNLNFAIPINDVKPLLQLNTITPLHNINFLNP